MLTARLRSFLATAMVLPAGCATVAPKLDAELEACSRTLSSPAVEATVEFVNESSENVEIHWVRVRSGELVRYSSILPGRSQSQNTYIGHLWYVSSSDGRVAHVHCASSVRERVVVGTGV